MARKASRILSRRHAERPCRRRSGPRCRSCHTCPSRPAAALLFQAMMAGQDWTLPRYLSAYLESQSSFCTVTSSAQTTPSWALASQGHQGQDQQYENCKTKHFLHREFSLPFVYGLTSYRSTADRSLSTWLRYPASFLFVPVASQRFPQPSFVPGMEFGEWPIWIGRSGSPGRR